MARAFLFVLDSFGVGGAPDAEAYADAGADTYGHIVSACAHGGGDKPGLRRGPLNVPVMSSLGLGAASGSPVANIRPGAFCATAEEVSSGKDTPSGHWEIAGVPVPFAWGYFPETVPTFPPDLVAAIMRDADLPGILGDCHASGTDIIERFGEEHIRTGKPICYTSADSVFQIAAHEHHFGLERLYALCEIARRHVDALNIGRVIARPFTGETRDTFERTANRRDYAVPPPEPTLLDRLATRGSRVIGIGKIGDIFAHRGVTEVRKGAGNDALFDQALGAMDDADDGDLVFANFVDFDMLYGHRRNLVGYGAALQEFDTRLPELVSLLKADDLLIITADHGNDPTWKGTDHTRERTPILVVEKGKPARSLGIRQSFADIGQSIAKHLGLQPLATGTAWN